MKTTNKKTHNHQKFVSLRKKKKKKKDNQFHSTSTSSVRYMTYQLIKTIAINLPLKMEKHFKKYIMNNGPFLEGVNFPHKSPVTSPNQNMTGKALVRCTTK